MLSNNIRKTALTVIKRECVSHKLRKFTIFDAILGSMVAMILGFYINPKVIEIYERSYLGIPNKVDLIVRYKGIDLLLIWCMTCFVLVAKDYVLDEWKAFLANATFLAFVCGLVVFYPSLVDLVHLGLFME